MSIQPRAERVIAFTVVTPSVDDSIAFWRDQIGLTVAEQGLLSDPLPMTGRPYALLTHPESDRGIVRLLQAEAGAPAIRPRPGARSWDPGLAVMELGTTDPKRSFAQTTAKGAKTLSEPLPYLFRNAGTLQDVDVTSYAVFGPAGEQVFITRSERRNSKTGEPMTWKGYEGLHGPVGGSVIPVAKRAPVLRWYEHVLGLHVNVDVPCKQETVNQIMNMPADTQFQMIMLGPDPETGVGIEIEEFPNRSDQTEYPTALDRTGIAMITVRADDLQPIRDACEREGIEPTGEGAFPLPGDPRPDGFILRGPTGELIEVVG